ncbi:hypothetical protein Pmani_015496 [Petrolisthes manimaculis]|uniref:Uncharacterized protein n=1 Tax=Petrolisthes manimaculis TaxID=1843537 RepID=A0AAE1U9T9_9EUCA|nr:hypothetical protein Pmani_015496 [Petrolisthes manimaculis]
MEGDDLGERYPSHPVEGDDEEEKMETEEEEEKYHPSHERFPTDHVSTSTSTSSLVVTSRLPRHITNASISLSRKNNAIASRSIPHVNSAFNTSRSYKNIRSNSLPLEHRQRFQSLIVQDPCFYQLPCQHRFHSLIAI